MYREAAVTTAFYDGALKLFIEVPLVEKQHRFTLYKIFSLPEPQEEEGASRRSTRLPRCF